MTCLVTGFKGIATAKIEYINGCVQYCVVPPVGADGKRIDGEYIDHQQLLITGTGVVINNSFTGGTQADCPKNNY